MATDFNNVLDHLDALQEDDEEPEPRPPLVRVKRRLDPFACTDRQFFKRYRFTKPNVRRLANLLFPELYINDRGKPFSR